MVYLDVISAIRESDPKAYLKALGYDVFDFH